VDDVAGTTLAHASTLSKTVKASVSEANKSDAAKKVGAAIAKILLEKGIDKVVFDRNGYLYHGRVRALADAAREAGLKF
jgi:large subunit ribosomal protein L18